MSKAVLDALDRFSVETHCDDDDAAAAAAIFAGDFNTWS
jgi:endonuclease/exonuclease/phosphatase (EEP) superfamily protein YafD